METKKELQGENYQTKFKLGETLFFLMNGKIKESQVDSIRIEIKNNASNEEKYWFRVPKNNSTTDWEYVTKDHNEVFISRQALIDSL